ncbi:MAG TPA: hypothetical protein VNE62_00315 [Actinomycetota bacterium]|nr:hypothetical protein [Actinomycetota bacterium]
MRFSGLLYQAGPLTVIPYRLCVHPEAGPLFWYDEQAADALGPGFRRGDAALSQHVPRGASLSAEACDLAFELMSQAFTRYFADQVPRVVTCTSWLLDEQLAEYLPASSNIIGFQRRFEVVPGGRDDAEEILTHVFGPDRPGDLSQLPEDTTLQRAVLQHLRAGRNWRVRTGWIALPPSGEPSV